MKPQNIDDYIALQADETIETLMKIRETIQKAAPDALECISYGKPAYKLHGMLVYFAVFKNHYSLFAMPSSMEQFKEELKGYKTSKGGIQFSFKQEVPYLLITKIVKYRVAENLAKAEMKKMAKKK